MLSRSAPANVWHPAVLFHQDGAPPLRQQCLGEEVRQQDNLACPTQVSVRCDESSATTNYSFCSSKCQILCEIDICRTTGSAAIVHATQKSLLEASLMRQQCLDGEVLEWPLPKPGQQQRVYCVQMYCFKDAVQQRVDCSHKPSNATAGYPLPIPGQYQRMYGIQQYCFKIGRAHV